MGVNSVPHLAFNDLGPKDQESPVAIFLHGIMGNKKNLHGFVQKLHSEAKHWRFLTPDLRNHGESQGFLAPHTLMACASDIMHFCKLLNVKPQIIAGHSFGGKVALEFSKNSAFLRHAWVLDVDPGSSLMRSLDPKHDITASTLVEILEKISWPQPSRRSLIEALLQKGVSRAVAAWMTTNLKETSEGLILSLQLEAIKSMIQSFLETDYWPYLKQCSGVPLFHFVEAERGERISQDARKSLKVLESRGIARYYLIKNAGHFLHIDEPDQLIEVMKPSFISY